MPLMTTIGTKIHTLLHGQYVGQDEFGNVYYVERKQRKNRKRKRWVIYNGLAEASKVPPHWHGWLHYTIDTPPVTGLMPRKYKWQKAHLPNLTGTDARYLPPGHVLRGAEREKNISDYVAWKPE